MSTSDRSFIVLQSCKTVILHFIHNLGKKTRFLEFYYLTFLWSLNSLRKFEFPWEGGVWGEFSTRSDLIPKTKKKKKHVLTFRCYFELMISLKPSVEILYKLKSSNPAFEM